MQAAKNLLPATSTAGSGRLNAYSAKGMLSRFYLTRAGLGSTNSLSQDVNSKMSKNTEGGISFFKTAFLVMI